VAIETTFFTRGGLACIAPFCHTDQGFALGGVPSRVVGATCLWALKSFCIRISGMDVQE
jgi:hypothetical protein